MKLNKSFLLKIIPNDYSIKEGLLFLKRHMLGVSYSGRSTAPESLPKKFHANKGIAEKTILFTGDLMPTAGLDLTLTPNIQEFISDVDIVVINLEGVIHKKTSFQSLRHRKKIVNDIKSLFPQTEIIINCANNHANDFGSDVFQRSYDFLKESGFKVIGHKNEPSLVINDLNFCAVSSLSNKADPQIHYQKELTTNTLDSHIQQEKFNILLPHWGLEFTRYPTPKQVNISYSLIKKWDQIVGSHSHYPQIVTSQEIKKVKKIIAYSLGDFFFLTPLPIYQYGTLLKTTIGKINHKPVLVKSEYIDTRCVFRKKKIHLKEANLK